MRTVLGIHSAGYPNLFIMGGYQASFQFNLTFMLQTQGQHTAECIKYVRDRNYATIDAAPETEEWWVQEVIRHRGKTNRNAECTPGYYNFEGESNRRQDGNYNRFPPESGYRFCFARRRPPTRRALYPNSYGIRVYNGGMQRYCDHMAAVQQHMETHFRFG